MIPDMNVMAAQRREEREERRKTRNLALKMLRIGFHEFRGPIEETTAVSRAKKYAKKIIDEVFPL